MDMKQLLTRMRQLDEAGTAAGSQGTGMFNPDFQTKMDYDVTGGSANPADLSQATAAVDNQTSSTLSNADQVKKNNLVKQLYDLLSALTKAKTPTPAAECFKSGIAKSIMETFHLNEVELSPTGQINKVTADIDAIMQQLQPYSQDPDVQKAFAEVDRIKKASYAQAAPYKGGASDEKVKRFIELTGKIGKGPVKPMGAASTAAGTPSSTKPSSTKPGSSAQTTTGAKKSPLVQELQSALNEKGAGLKVDGVMGPQTSAAMSKFPEIAKQFPGVTAPAGQAPGTPKQTPKSNTAPTGAAPQTSTKPAGDASSAVDKLADRMDKLFADKQKQQGK